MTPSAALEALDMLEPIFFLHLLELLNVRALIMKMTHFMASIAHEMRKLLTCFLLHLLFLSPFVTFLKPRPLLSPKFI